MKKIDPRLIEMILFVILVIYIVAIWLGTTPVNACTLQAGISKQINQYNEQQCVPIAGISKQLLNLEDKENEPSVEENEQIIVEQSLGKQLDVPPNNSFKSYMDGDTIKSRNTDQYKLKDKYVLDEKTGIWTVDRRYCIAIGSYYTKQIGTYIDVVMENGITLHCILGECKRNRDTDNTNRQNPNGSVVEFIVNISSMPSMVRKMGDCSYADESMFGEIESIIIYD
nr:MAG TPA: hypothetical protein [Caudoviricetes sp.]